MTLSSASSTTSFTLLQRVQQNEPAAWQRLVRLYGDLVYGWARGFRLQNDDAADVLQEVFQVVHRALPQYRHEEHGTFRGWLWTVTLNKSRDLIRARGRRPEVPGGDDLQQRLLDLPDPLEEDLFPDVAPSHGQLLQRAATLIREDFDPKSWACFERIVLNDQPARDVALELQMTVAAVRQAKYRVLRHLRTFVSDIL